MRALSGPLALAQLNVERRPAYRFKLYDLRTAKIQNTPFTISDVVLGNALPPIAGPLDITQFVEQATLTENASNSTEQSLNGCSLRISFLDRLNVYDPVTGSEPRWLRAGNVITLEESDENVPGEWIKTFTGFLVGQAGSDPKDRSGGAALEIQCEDRMAAFLKTTVTTRVFPQQTLLVDIANAMASEDMGLSTGEWDFGSVGLTITEHATTQIVDESPMVALAKLFFIDGFQPYFKGDGTLSARQIQVGQSAARVYESDDLIVGIARPFSNLDGANTVEVRGLDARQSRNVQEATVIATAGLTLGFFGGDASIKVSWSDDKSLYATGVNLNVISSVTGALIPFGAEDLEIQIDDEELDSFGVPTFQGSLGGRINVVGAFYAPLVTVLFALRIVASAIPDNVPLTGVTIPVGRLIEGAASIAISTILGTIGRGEYEVRGKPYEYVYKELRGRAQVAGVGTEDERVISFENHLLSTQTLVDSIAQRELLLSRKRGNVRKITMRHDLLLEPGDSFRLPNGRAYILQTITRTINREANQLVEIDAFEITSGVNP